MPYYHLQDVGGRLPADRLAAIHIAPDSEVLLQVIEAAQAMKGRVGLICGNPSSVERLSSLFRFYTSNEIRIAHYGGREADDSGHRGLPGAVRDP